ncbi:5414_t:CDS:2 [Rhizophagus irregularis]|nr:5414_t:CDS:2 [Rhizophagus irregularis]
MKLQVIFSTLLFVILMLLNLICLGFFIAKYLSLKRINFEIPINNVDYVYLGLISVTALKDAFRGSLNLLNPRQQIISQILLLIAWIVVPTLYTKFELDRQLLSSMCPQQYMMVCLLQILRHTGSIIDLKRVIPNNYELFFEYCVMNLGFVLSALYLFQLNQRRKQGPYKLHIFVDCVLMNAWMIFGILRLSPQFDMSNILTCNQYQFKQREGCITYISTLVLGYVISAGSKNINVAINQDDIEFNRSDGTIVIFRKPSPSFLKHERFSDNSSNNSYISEYSLGSSFSRTYGSIIIPRKYSDDSNIIGRNQIVSTHSENSINSKRLSSTFSDKTSRSSNYDGSIIIKLVT